jgi:hypothetical protein
MMITNPYLPSPGASNAWAEGFIKGFAGPIYTTEPPPNIASEDVVAYAEGVISGQQSAIKGLSFAGPCISAGEGHNAISEANHFINVLEIGHGAWEAVHLGKLVAGLTGVTVAFIELACTLPVHAQPPEQVLPNLGQTLVDTLSLYGLDSIELFSAAGLDPTSSACEIAVSPMFKSLDEARQAAAAMGRKDWVIVSWRTDACSSFRVVESS